MKLSVNEQLLKNLGIIPSISVTYVRLFELYFNNFMTVARFAEYQEMSEKHAKKVINKGRIIRESNFSSITSIVSDHFQSESK